jgi:N-acetylmuramoyl-L-alanine amidase
MTDGKYTLITKRQLTPKTDTTPKKILVRRKKIIVIDPGHGGRDPGAIYPINSKNPIVTEKEIAREISTELKSMLDKTGNYETYSTRRLDKDDYVHDYNANKVVGYVVSQGRISMEKQKKPKAVKKNDQQESLLDRAAFADLKDADLFISIHANSVTNPKANGMNGLIDIEMTSSMKKECEKFRSILKAKLGSKKYNVDNFNMERSLGVIRNQEYERPSVLLETGFISNEKDRIMLRVKEHQRLIASSIKEAIDDYFK